LKFPEIPTCHGDTTSGGIFMFAKDTTWRPAEDGTPATRSHPDNDGPFRPFRTCTHCGSMHPEDLLTALEAGAKMTGSDWKYAWPHKQYVSEISHPFEHVPVVVSSSYHNGVRVPGEAKPMGKAWGKWYNEHIMDDGFDDEARAALISALEKHSGIRFNVDPEKGLGYAAPHHNYQRG
jgi:hypothetical protein